MHACYLHLLKQSSCSLLSRLTNAQHIYINNILYIVSTATCFDAPAPPSAMLNLQISLRLQTQSNWLPLRLTQDDAGASKHVTVRVIYKIK